MDNNKKGMVRVGKEAIAKRGETHFFLQEETKWARSRCYHVCCGEHIRKQPK